MIKVADIPRKFDSKLERDFWLWLASEREAGRIKQFWYHELRLRIGGAVGNGPDSWFTPDFIAQTQDDELVVYETKGHMREAARVRLRAAATMHPYRIYVVEKGEAGFTFTQVEP